MVTTCRRGRKQVCNGRQREASARLRGHGYQVMPGACPVRPRPNSARPRIPPPGTAAPGADAPQLRRAAQRAARIPRRRACSTARSRSRCTSAFRSFPRASCRGCARAWCNQDTLAPVWRARSTLGARMRLGEGETEERRCRAPVDPRRCARGGVRRGVRRRRIRGRRDAAIGASTASRASRRSIRQRLAQGSEDRAAGVAAGRAACRVPEYAVLAVEGEAHEQTFEVECRMPRLGIGARPGPSRRAPSRRPRRARMSMLRGARRRGAGAASRAGISAAARRDRRPAQRRQVDAAQPAGRRAGGHHLAQGADHAPSRERHPRPRRDASSSSSTRPASRRDGLQRSCTTHAQSRGAARASATWMSCSWVMRAGGISADDRACWRASRRRGGDRRAEQGRPLARARQRACRSLDACHAARFAAIVPGQRAKGTQREAPAREIRRRAAGGPPRYAEDEHHRPRRALSRRGAACARRSSGCWARASLRDRGRDRQVRGGGRTAPHRGHHLRGQGRASARS